MVSVGSTYTAIDMVATCLYHQMTECYLHDQLASHVECGSLNCRSGNVGEKGGEIMQVSATFGATLKGYREARRVSQSRLAERAGFDHSYVSRLESGARTPTRDAVQQLGDALELDGLQQDELFASAGFLPLEVSSLLSAEPEITDVLALLQNSSMPEDYRQGMRQVLRVIADQARLVLKDNESISVA